MRIRFTKHALERMNERDIEEAFVRNMILIPNRMVVSRSNDKRFLVKATRRFREKSHIVMVVCERSGTEVVVVTVIDTSKISKYS